jgi:hypothetical protein
LPSLHQLKRNPFAISFIFAFSTQILKADTGGMRMLSD